MKTVLVFGILTSIAFVGANNRMSCKCLYQVSSGKVASPLIPTEWANMVDSCVIKVKEQIMNEISAAITYMAMGAHFSRDTINRPGFAKLFFDAATEEREHAIKLIEYLLMRGDLFNDLQSVIANVPKPQNTSWADGYEALTEALKLEAKVTQLIIGIIKECETPQNNKMSNDYHVVDYLTADFLLEQYKGQRILAGKASTLGKMIKNHGALGEFLFDKKLLNVAL